MQNQKLQREEGVVLVVKKGKVNKLEEPKFNREGKGNEPVESKVINKGKVNKPKDPKFKKKGNGKENVESKVNR